MPDCLADYIAFDFDLSKYDCDFDIYIILHTPFIFDNAFSNFKFSDNIKSVNIYLIGCYEIGHEAFAALNNIEKVDVRLMSYWHLLDYYGQYYQVTDYASKTIVYPDSFSQETYNTALLETYTTESDINEILTNPSAKNYSNNFYRFFKRWHTGVGEISIDEYPVEYEVHGRTIVFSNLTPHETVSVYTLIGTSIGNYVADYSGTLNINIDQPGVYLIQVNNTCYKTSIY